MTPIERWLDGERAAWLERQWYEAEAWAAKTRRAIHATAVVAHRSIGQQVRYIAVRVAAQRGGKK